MIKTKKTEAEKQLFKFRNQLHNLLIRYPDIWISGDTNGDVIAAILKEGQYTRTYLPSSGKQELIKH